MELRSPPQTSHSRSSVPLRTQVLAHLAVVMVLGAWTYWVVRHPGSASHDIHRHVASKLKAGGATAQALALYEQYLQRHDVDPEVRANLAYTLGDAYMSQGETQKALRWYYESETAAQTADNKDVGTKIVHALERLGKVHAAQAALAARTKIDANQVNRSAEDPVVAKIGQRDIARSEVEQALDALPPQLAERFGTGASRQEFLQKYVADELLWEKAKKLEYTERPDIKESARELTKQLVISKFVENEIVGKVQVDPNDVRNFFEANKEKFLEQYNQSAKSKKTNITFEEVHSQVVAAYKLNKVQSAYQQLLQEQNSAQNVVLYPERMASK